LGKFRQLARLEMVSKPGVPLRYRESTRRSSKSSRALVALICGLFSNRVNPLVHDLSVLVSVTATACSLHEKNAVIAGCKFPLCIEEWKKREKV
jgi:hypothetical protein